MEAENAMHELVEQKTAESGAVCLCCPGLVLIRFSVEWSSKANGSVDGDSPSQVEGSPSSNRSHQPNRPASELPLQ